MPRTRQEWDGFVHNEHKVTWGPSFRMSDLFYSFESETFRKDLTAEESQITLSSDLTHETQKTTVA